MHPYQVMVLQSLISQPDGHRSLKHEKEDYEDLVKDGLVELTVEAHPTKGHPIYVHRITEKGRAAVKP